MGVSFEAHGGYGFPVNLWGSVLKSSKEIQKTIWKRLPSEARGYFSNRKEFFSEDSYDSDMLIAAFPEISFISIINPYAEYRDEQKPDWLAVARRSQSTVYDDAGAVRLPVESYMPTAEELEALSVLKSFAPKGDRKPGWHIGFSIG